MVVGYRVSEGEGFFTPGAGNEFYFIDVEIANIGSSVESISSLLMFDLRDEEGFSQDISFSAVTLGRSGLDGAILPGRVIRGELAYEIPIDSRSYELQINLHVFGTAGIFSVAMDEVSVTPANPNTLRSAATGVEFAIGEPVEIENLEFVVNGIRTDSGSGFFTPDAGYTYLLVDVSVTNNGSEAELISSMLMFTLRDSEGFAYTSSMGALSVGRGGLDGDVMVGSTLRGELGFEVPEGITGLELFINPNVFRAEDTVVVSLD